MDDTVIKVENLSKAFGKKKILTDVNLEINRGTIFGYLGPNGSGKTTTIRILLGLLRPTRGRVTVFGQDSEKMTPETRARIGVVLDDHGLYDSLTAYQNLEYYSQIFRLPASSRNSRIRECLEYVDMVEYSKEKVKFFSKGMKQRVALARCLLNNPEIVFLDEPTSGLDPDAAAKIRDLLLELVRNYQTTIFLNSHDLDGIERLATVISILKQGEIIAQGSIAELRRRLNKSVLEIHLLENSNMSGIEDRIRTLPFVKGINSFENHTIIVEILNNDYQPELIRFCVESGLQVCEVRQAGSSLEDVYLSIVKDAEKNAK
jgi:ABC-2 type transport system ATP-binding protein